VSAEYGKSDFASATPDKNEEAIFNEAIKIKSSAERAAFVKSACGDDTALLARVEAMLKVHFEDESFLKSPPAGIAGTLDAPPLTEGPGTRIGRYKLLQLIGEGGFGVVYMAEQQEPIRRNVALKIIKLGMDTKQVIARFEAERQALAMMDHPNIARVFDAGATDTGRLYFVMELVKGIPITEYCDKNDLDTQKRLELFIDVCKAVQHAHQKGIIHRDIKPSNVMITLHDGKPVPKIIDFGIAKATQQRLTEKTLFTEYGQFIGTPEYMSPEQAEMSGLDVDTRTDIYSLGVLLYELLTGTTPFEADKLRSAAYDEIRRIIREDEPPRPSTRLSTLGEALTDIAKHRDAQPGELCKIVRGDLDWVVMKTIEKDRTRRYETANELAMDIKRHLSDEPVSAGPPSMRYRLHKFARRHRTGVAAGLLVAAAIVLGLVVSTTMYFQAEQALRMEAAARAEAERQAMISQAVTKFLTNKILNSLSPWKAKSPEVTVRYVLEAASKNLESKFKDAPSVEASVRDTLGEIYMAIGKYKVAETHLERAIELRRDQFGKEHPDTLKSMTNLSEVYQAEGRYNEAEPLLVKALEIQRRVLGDESSGTLNSMTRLGSLYSEWGRYNKAEPLLVEALEIRRRVLGEEHPATLWSMSNLGELYTRQGRYNEAEPLCVKALEIRRRVQGEEHIETLWSMHSVGELYTRQGRYNEAETLFVKSVEGRRRLLGEGHPETLWSMQCLGELYARQGRYDETAALYAKVLELWGLLDTNDPYRLKFINNFAPSWNDLAWRQATSPNAELRNGIGAVMNATKACELTNWKNASYVDTLAAAYAETGDFNSAVKWQKEAINLLTKKEPAEYQAGFEERLKLYQSGKPYHKSP
jgi:serine/threonine protein kinase/Tfp pilus assembly protein PilF